MYSIVFFGKPASDEAIEFKNNSFSKLTSGIYPKFQPPKEPGFIYRQCFISGYWYLQVYKHAQAFEFARDGDSIGVAIKSEKHICLTKNNFSILKEILTRFSKFSLDEKEKYKTGTLLELLNQFLLQNTFNTFNIDLDEIKVDVKKILLYQKDLNVVGLNSLPNVLAPISDLYITSNNELHTFGIYNPTYYKDFGSRYYTIDYSLNKISVYKSPNIEPITEPVQKPNTGRNDNWGRETPKNDTEQYNEIATKNSKLQFDNKKLQDVKDKLEKKFKIASILAVVFCLSTLAFFFKSLFLDDSKDASIVQQSTEQIEGVSNGDETTTEQENPVNLNVILANDDNRNTLNTLLQNIKNYETSLDKKKYSDDIIRDANILGLDKSFIKKYESEQTKPLETTNVVPNKQRQKSANIVPQEKTNKDIKEKTEKEAQVKAEKVKAEKEAKEKTSKEAQEKAEKEAQVKAEKVKAEKEAKEKTSKEAQEKADKEAQEKAKKQNGDQK